MAIATINPTTGETLKTFEPLSGAQIEQKIQHAAGAFRKFREMSFAQRAEMMRKVADVLDKEKDTFGRLM
jgi:succinate-semialdehyde dehydrogenase / glutarate-semialdehyde dehydrogenase